MATIPTPANLNDTVAQTGGAKLTVDTYCNVVVNQASITLDSLPELSSALQTAKDNATTWLHELSPLMIERVTDVVGFGDTWAGFTATIKQLIGAIDEGNNRAELVEVLQAMCDNHLAPLERAALDSATQVGNLNIAFAHDKSAFDTLLDKATSIYLGDQGEIAQLQKASDSLQEAMSRMMALIAGSATAIVVGGLAIAVGVLAELPTAGASTAVIAGGALVVAGGIAGVVTGAVLYNKDLKAYSADLSQMATDKTAMAALTAMHGQVKNLSDANAQAQSALTAIANSWTTIKGMFDNMILDVNEATLIPAVALGDITAADLDWKKLTDTANALAQNFGVPPVHVDLTQPAEIVVKEAA